MVRTHGGFHLVVLILLHLQLLLNCHITNQKPEVTTRAIRVFVVFTPRGLTAKWTDKIIKRAIIKHSLHESKTLALHIEVL